MEDQGIGDDRELLPILRKGVPMPTPDDVTYARPTDTAVYVFARHLTRTELVRIKEHAEKTYGMVAIVHAFRPFVVAYDWGDGKPGSGKVTTALQESIVSDVTDEDRERADDFLRRHDVGVGNPCITRDALYLRFAEARRAARCQAFLEAKGECEDGNLCRCQARIDDLAAKDGGK
jgi:hypothetical protein